MEITEFFELSIGRWRSQRSGHHLAFAHFEQVLSDIDIESLSTDDPAVLAICQLYDDGIFTLLTEYELAAAEKRIWFATRNRRFGLATIKTSDGKGVTTASFSSEIRSLSNSTS